MDKFAKAFLMIAMISATLASSVYAEEEATEAAPAAEEKSAE